MYTFVILLFSFGVVFPKLCLMSIQLKNLKNKTKQKNQKLMPVHSGSMEASSRHPFQHMGKGRLQLQCRRCVPWSAARDRNTAMLGEDQEGK